jgi:hypothetical protein
MDLNVKLQGLKYSFGKVQGCFCEIQQAGNFWNCFSIENSWNRSMVGGPRPRRLGLQVYDRVINLGLQFNLEGLDFMKSRSNPDHQSLLGRP